MSFWKKPTLRNRLVGFAIIFDGIGKACRILPDKPKPNSTSRLAFAFLARKTQKFNQQKQSMKTARKTAVFAYQRVARSFAESGLNYVYTYPPLLIGGYTNYFDKNGYVQNALYLGRRTNYLKTSQICRTGRSLVVIVVLIAFLCVPFGAKIMPKKRQK